MKLIEKYIPLNKKEILQSLVDELKGIPGAMNPAMRQEIFLNIHNRKLQTLFQTEYPESLFTDPGSLIPETHDNIYAAASPAASPAWEIRYLPAETQLEKKSVYGTYIEMAFHNFYQTMHHIYALVFGEDLMEVARGIFEKENPDSEKTFDEDFASKREIWSPMFLRFEKARQEQKEHLDYLFSRHFPFLKVLDALPEDRRITKTDALGKFSNVLRELRNIYSHYHFQPTRWQTDRYQEDIPFLLELADVLYLGAQREVKARFGFSDQKMCCAQKYEPNGDRRLRDKNGRVVRVVAKKNFKYALYSCQDKVKKITPFGIVFLSSLFLEKKYAKIMADKTHCIRYADQEVMCELISVYRIRLHVQKLNVTKQTDALALDIINELQRCPRLLFDMLPPAEQQKFRIKPASSQDPEVLMVRYHDRFAHLMLKYIDDAKLFDRIRFQVSLGKYFFRFYDKRCIDSTGDKRVRSIGKDVNGFGRITEVENNRVEKYGKMVRACEDVHAHTANEQPYITDHHAKYLINNHKIGIYIRKDNDTQYLLPELTPEGIRNVVPTCWLSTYDLPAMAFLLHLCNGDGSRVEDLILTEVANYRRLFADVGDGKVRPVADEDALATLLEAYGGIKPSNLPRKMLDYLLARKVCTNEVFHGWAQAELQRMIEQTDRRMMSMEEDLRMSSDIRQNKFGKKSFVAIQPGRIASFLAHDMMFFQPNGADGNSNKLTGLNFRILQSAMAVYDGHFEELSRIMSNAHIIGNAHDESCNPIVMAVCRQSSHFDSITTFYMAYLKARKAYLQDCLSMGDYTSLDFLHPTQSKWKERTQEYYQSLAARYLTDEYGGTTSDKAIELPRGLFDSSIRKELSEIAAMKAVAHDPTKNIAYLIYGYMKQVMGDDAQLFYDTPRCYQLFNVLYRKTPRDGQVFRHTAEIREMLMRHHPQSIHRDIANYLSQTTALTRATEEQRCHALLHKMKDSETELKRYKTQDILLFLIAKRILLDRQVENDSAIQMGAISHIHLKNIADGDTLSQKISFNVTITSKNGYTKVLKQDDLKLKNYAQFYAIINDRRLPSLLDLINSRYISRPTLEAELNNYDKAHPHVLESIFEYEKHYLATHPVSADEAIPNIRAMLKDSEMPEDTQNEVHKIRNAFAHHAYPKRYVANAGSIELPKKAETISNKLITHLKNESN
ncbi:MAG: type VI-B CRISPR-associated RNA-guided ribonuclease Cas13b [Prevotella sp.]